MEERARTPGQRAIPLAGFLARANRWWLAALVGVGLSLASVAVYQVHGGAVAEVERTTRVLAQEIDSELQQRVHGLQAMVLAVVQAHPEASPSEWREHALAYDRVFDTPIVLLSADRRMLMNTRVPSGSAMPPVPQPPPRPALAEALAGGEPRVGDVVPGALIREPVVPVVVPIPGPGGSAAARALIGAVPARIIQAHLVRLDLPDSLRVKVADGSGGLVASHGDVRTLQGVASGAAPTASLPLSAAPWTVTVQADPVAFYRVHARIGLVLVAGLGLALGGAWWAARRAARGLTRAVQQLAPPGAWPDSGVALTAVAAAPRIREVEAARQALLQLGRAEHRAQERERGRIARELHDGVQQEVAVAATYLDLALAQVSADAQEAELLRRAREALTRLKREVQQAVHDLRPRALETGSLEPALRDLVERMRLTSGARVTLQWLGQPEGQARLPESVADGLYRITQECLNNVRKHAQAQSVIVTVDLRDALEARLTVSDDGVGLAANPAGPDGGFGLAGMSQRVAELGGVLRVTSEPGPGPGRGTTVTARVPLRG